MHFTDIIVQEYHDTLYDLFEPFSKSQAFPGLTQSHM